MPGKSRHGKGKHSRYSKKSKALRRQGITPVPQATSNMPDVPKQMTPTSAMPVLKAATIAPGKTAANQYPYITSELRRIAILAGIIVVILIVLSIVLS